MPRPSNAGFALIAVLWVLAALSALTAVGLATARVGSMTTRNRIVLSRAAWAREACIDILRARFARDTMTLQVSKTDLGRGTWCTAKLEDPSGKVDVNRADRPTIERLMLNMGVQPSVAESILTIRRRARIYDVTQIPGVDSALAARLARVLTTRGSIAVNLNAASREILATLPGMSTEAIEVVLSQRTTQRPLVGADDLARRLSKSGRTALYANYEPFSTRAVFSPAHLILVAEGGVRGTALVAHATLTAAPVAGRLAIIRRESE